MRPVLIQTAPLLSTAGASAWDGDGISGTGSSGHGRSVSGYTPAHGTTVANHDASKPNGTQRDTDGTRGNIDSYTGAAGTHGADH
ncbi:hypothetical protein ACRAWG_12885 [Methylobacterium sp. P31]